METRHRRALAAALLAAGALLLLLPGPPKDPLAAKAASAPSARHDEGEGHAAAPPASAASEARPLPLPSNPEEFLARMKHERTAYANASRFPHWSYPLTPDMTFLLKWNDATPSDVPFDESENPVHVDFDADRGRVLYGEALTAWIDAWRIERGRRSAVPFVVRGARVTLTGGPNAGAEVPVTFNDEGRDGDAVPGDLRATTRFAPRDHAAFAISAEARLEAYVEIDGEVRRFVRDFVYTPRPVLTVLDAKERIADGSLVVTLTANVLEKGTYTFYANLFDATGERPISTVKLSYPLEAGTTTADLVFFGKTIYESGIDGPYVVKDVHGLKRQEGDEMDLWWSDARTFSTAAHGFTDFSSAEWAGDERREKLAHFDRIIGQMVRAR